MLIIRFSSRDNKELGLINYDICESLRGYPPYIDGGVFVSSVEPKTRHEDAFEFDVIVGTEEDTCKIETIDVNLDLSSVERSWSYL